MSDEYKENQNFEEGAAGCGEMIDLGCDDQSDSKTGGRYAG